KEAALALSELGYTWRNAGEVDRGNQLLREAADEAQQLGDHDDAARWRLQFVGPEPAQGESPATMVQRAASIIDSDPDGALRLGRSLVKIAVKNGNSMFEAEARNIVA